MRHLTPTTREPREDRDRFPTPETREPAGQGPLTGVCVVCDGRVDLRQGRRGPSPRPRSPGCVVVRVVPHSVTRHTVRDTRGDWTSSVPRAWEHSFDGRRKRPSDSPPGPRLVVEQRSVSLFHHSHGR